MAQIDLGIFLGEREEHDDEARALLVRALRERWEDKDEKLSASALRGLAVLALASDEGNRAKTLIDAASALSIPIRDRLGEWQSLILRTRIDSSMQQFKDVARIAAILEVFGAHSGMVLPPRDEIAVQSAQIAARAVIGHEYEAAVASGRASAAPTNGQVDLEQAVTALVGTVDVEAVVAAAAPTAGEGTA